MLRGTRKELTPMNNWFDNLAKRMAGRVSRREAIRNVGGAAGGFLAMLGIEQPAAADGANECAHFCQQFPPGDRARCLAICKDCDRDPQRVCPGPNGGLVCCPDGTFCVNKSCCRREAICQVPGTPQLTCCPDGLVCRDG